MKDVTEKLEILLRFSLVYAFILLFFILNVIGASASHTDALEIPFILMFIYYWSIYRPLLIPPILAFLIGLTFDLLSGLPVGLSSFLFVLVRQLTSEQRIFLSSQTFFVVWLGFMVVCASGILIQWTLFGLVNLEWPPIEPPLRVIVIGIILFPLISLFLNLSHKILPDVQGEYAAVNS